VVAQRDIAIIASEEMSSLFLIFIGDLECPQKCHCNAQCIELVFGGRRCVCNPGFEGDGIECAGIVFFSWGFTLLPNKGASVLFNSLSSPVVSH